ncbi:hypothetical protein AKJ36_01255 [candidate division MSBL1 archaeon SCGC-AAA259I07]|uniref:Uncharacterized protein n=1 Tax=candidate division MSBL1 archaeon SCGC-AAA259I07 TaxID=1698266 RepID=A0A133ULW0_9EURY|nr:hypothetical protein AKJ36_01255 [candidate division MSBL1 archaeon SCGC-AAA259I07]
METDTEQKLRGGFYTPRPIAEFLAEWAISSGNEKILEPGCGNGNILLPATKQLEENKGKITGVEFYEVEADKAEKRLLDNNIDPSLFKIVRDDFFKFCINEHRWENKSYDAVIGNPPFIRYQDFDKKQRVRASEILENSGIHPTKQMNAWMPFLVGSVQLLRGEGGRLAMIIPAALMQVNYAEELREFLSRSFSRLTIITFEKLVFDGIEEEVVLLLGETDGEESVGINVIELKDLSDLESYTYEEFKHEDIKSLDHSTEKWTMYYLDNKEIELIRRLKKNTQLNSVGDYADVNVGVVTGRNAFFVLDKEQVEEHGLKDYIKPIVSRSSHLGKGVKFAEEIYKKNKEEGKRCYLLNLPDKDASEFPNKVQKYIQEGENKEYHKGYKCSIRDPWYKVPTTWTPDGFLLRQIHQYPKFVLNETQATCTDTIHRVKFKENKEEMKNFFAVTHNSLTWAFSEFIGRSYGGGVLELEPNEAEELPIPTSNWEKISLNKVNQILKEKGPHGLLDYTDRILLKEGLDLSDKEIETLRNIWEKLHQRRINRN